VKRKIVGIGVAALASASPAHGHHSRTPVYDGARIVTVEGVVQEFHLVNPHATLLLEATDASGRVLIWTVEFQGLNALTRGGWTPEEFKPGERLRVSGEPARSGAPEVFFRSAIRADGARVFPPGREEAEAIDALRRERAQQRKSE
jgi:uncharacterized protein DUF6152